MTFGACPLSVPCAGCVTILYVKASPSTSLPLKTIALAVSSWVLTDRAWATGKSFSELTSTVKLVCTLSVPSETLSVTGTGPP